MKLVLATRNEGKVREIGELLKDQNGVELLSLRSYPDAPDVVEDGKTYKENAIKKASVLAEYTGHLTIADDSGLAVDALDGAPGVHSARYAGENASDQDRILKLLDALQNVPDDRRSGRFICAVAIAEPLGIRYRLFVVSVRAELYARLVEQLALDMIQSSSPWAMTKPLRSWATRLRIRLATVRRRWPKRENY